MMFRRKSAERGPLRYLVYVSDQKIQLLLDQIGEPARRSIAAELKLDLKLISLTLTSPAVDASLRYRSRMAKLAVVEDYIERHHQVGDLTATRGYFTGRLAMDWQPFDDDTVLFCGYAGTTLVVLGGSVGHLLGRSPSEMQVGSHPYAIRQALAAGILQDGDAPRAAAADIGRGLDTAARAVYHTPQEVSFLARVISRGPLGSGSAHTDYLLATPLYVEAVDAAVV